MTMDELEFDKIARLELAHIEEGLEEVDPDLVEVTSTDGVVTLELADGVKVVINSHRAARQIWMAAVVDAWHFDPSPDGLWRTRENEELRGTLRTVIAAHTGLDVGF